VQAEINLGESLTIDSLERAASALGRAEDDMIKLARRDFGAESS
jgi:hypothetical protein